MAWRQPGDKPLSGPMMVRLPTHICITRPQWVKDYKRCNHILYHILDFVQQKKTKFTMEQYYRYMLPILYCQCHFCWCHGDLRSQGISRHGIDQISLNVPSLASEELTSSVLCFAHVYWLLALFANLINPIYFACTNGFHFHSFLVVTCPMSSDHINFSIYDCCSIADYVYMFTISYVWQWPRPTFYLWLSKVSANERECYICNIFSHWLTPCSVTDPYWLSKASANERRRYICNVFSHWPRPCSATDPSWLSMVSANERRRYICNVFSH